MTQFSKMIEEGKPQKEISSYLDSLGHEQRLKEVQTLSGSVQRKLWALAKADLSLHEFFPFNQPPLQEVIFYGRNSLPLPGMNLFQKRMCRSQDGKTIWGYNHQSLQCITGPGSFVVTEESDRPGEIMIDYTRLPTGSPPQWPAVKSNSSGITALVYGHMKDYMRRVSKNVFIGEATKKGKKINQYFLLCRK